MYFLIAKQENNRIEKVNFEKSQQTNKKLMKNIQHAESE